MSLVTIPKPRGRFDRYYRAAYRASRQIPQADLLHAHGDDWFVRTETPVVRSFYGSSLGEARSSKGLRKANHYILAGLEWRAAQRASFRLGIAPESAEIFRCDSVFPPYIGFSRRSAIGKSQSPSVAFIGSHGGRKRGHMIESAIQRLRDLGLDIELHVIGPASDRASWRDWVTHHSNASDDEVARLVGSSWLLASPSSYEGFGIPMLEGLEASTRVIACHNPGSDFLESRANDAVPLTVVEDSQFEDSVAELLTMGSAALTPDESSAAISFCEEIASLGSPERLLGIYDEVLATTSR